MTLLRQMMLAVFRLLPTSLSKWIVFLLKRKYVVGVVAVVPNGRGECLFLHHTYRRKRPWRLPGGLKERREEPFATVVRELREEANMTVRPLRVIGVSQSEITLDILVLCELLETGPFQVNEEIDAFAWADPFAGPFELPEDQKRVLAEVLTTEARVSPPGV
jgi:8-oxo-dGTP pyrophosphatase MutT (NUDIX family)